MLKSIISIVTQYNGLSRSAYVIFFSRIVTNMGAFIWPLLTLILSRKIGYSPTSIAILFTIIGLLFIPTNLIGGKLADKYNRKKIIIIFDTISVICFILCSFIEPGNLMVVLFVLAGMFANMEGPAFEALIADSTKPSEREKVYSLSYLGHNFGYIVGAAVGGLLFENYLNIAFLFDGLTTISSTILIILFVKVLNVDTLHESEKNEYEDSISKEENVFEVLRKRKSLIVQMFAFTLAAFIYNQWTFVLPLYMESIYLENGAKYYGLVASFNGFVVILFTPIITKIMSKFTELPKIMIGLFMYSLSFLIIRNYPEYYVFYIMMLMFTLGEIFSILGGGPFISRRVPASHRGRISSIEGTFYFVGAMVGRIIIGLVVDKYSYNLAFSIIGVLGVIATLIVVYNYYLDKSIFPKLYSKDSNEAKEITISKKL